MNPRVLAGLLFGVALLAENWPGWRGTDASGISREAAVPLQWGKTENVKWRVTLPEPGNSTPVVWGDTVYVTQAEKAIGKRLLLAFERGTGMVRWSAAVPYGAEPTHPTNPFGSASPVTDGDVVVAWFGSAGVHAFDAKTGKTRWTRDLGIQKHTWGYGSSPVLHRNFVFLNFGPGERSFVVALDRKTGKTVWQVDVPKGAGAKFNQWSPEDMYGSWSTPVVHGDELLVTLPRKLVAYELATGKVLWSSEGLSDLIYPSPVVAEGMIVAASGFGGAAMAVKTGGAGDVTASHRVWHWPKNKGFIGSGVVKDGHLYWVDIGGIAQCVKLSNGEAMWSARLPRAGEDNGVWGSPVLHGDHVYVMNKSGNTVVFRAQPGSFEAMGTNVLDEPSNSSVVISGGEIFLRTHKALWCIRKPS
ncbi:MAG: PQQ-binding-like beta-propeller repeat protein [Bryobacteraceae bacterium]